MKYKIGKHKVGQVIVRKDYRKYLVTSSSLDLARNAIFYTLKDNKEKLFIYHIAEKEMFLNRAEVLKYQRRAYLYNKIKSRLAK